MSNEKTDIEIPEHFDEVMRINKAKRAVGQPPAFVHRDEQGRFAYGHAWLPLTTNGIRAMALKAFLDKLNGIAGEKRLARIAEIAEGHAVATAIGKDGQPQDVTPTIREQLDANTTLLYMQHGRPAVQVDVQASHTVKVRWDPDKYARVEDLEKYLQLQKMGEVVDAPRFAESSAQAIADAEDKVTDTVAGNDGDKNDA